MKTLLLSLALLGATTLATAQVTIGSPDRPAPGALLDLKQSGTTTKGLGLPRVKLAAFDQLTLGTNVIPNASNAWIDHTGLIVYNVSGNPIPKCAPIPDGLYVWDGAKWQGMSAPATQIEQWAIAAGFTQAQINTVKTTGTDSSILATGIQLHRDQSNNLFLSSSFHATDITGDSERWMIHNLAAKTYAAGVTHSASRTLSGPNGNAGNLLNTAYWAYPSNTPKPSPNQAQMDPTNATNYDNNQRLGLLYTWDAATAGKGGADGQTNVDNSGVLQESGRREGNAATEQKRRQGICPSGWHLPSDDEWSLLEQDIVTNKSSFSSLATSTEADELTNTTYGVIRTNAGVVGQQGYRGLVTNAKGHGNAMKEICEPGIGNFKGASHGITSTSRPGFDTFLAGSAYSGSAFNFGIVGYFWSASSYNDNRAWSRDFGRDSSQVYRNAYNRYTLYSVRCKKN